jgi:phenylpyruvate tautomerase PptA (4-oxalocrotonate tautomerase family)
MILRGHDVAVKAELALAGPRSFIMPFARVSLLKGKPPEFIRSLSDNLHHALVDAFDVPADDRFQAFHQHEPGEFVFDRHYLGGARSDDFVLIAITAGRPRSTDTKKAFYGRLVALLAERPGLRPEDVMVVITTTGSDDWSFGGGRASMVEEAAQLVRP